MSREIGFRVWDNQEKTYSDKAFLIDQLGICYVQDEEGYWEEIDDSRFIVEFETGLTDKNADMICEGDIVKWLNGLNEDIAFKVEWQDNRARFCLRNEYSVFDYRDLSDKKNIEVVGNVHEDGELLGSEEWKNLTRSL